MDNVMLQGVLNDITERKRAEFAAQQLASRDTLTGLLNRRGIDAGIAAVFEDRQREPDLAIAFMRLALDYFKQNNDNYGTDAGDFVLCRVDDVPDRSEACTELVS